MDYTVYICCLGTCSWRDHYGTIHIFAWWHHSHMACLVCSSPSGWAYLSVMQRLACLQWPDPVGPQNCKSGSIPEDSLLSSQHANSRTRAPIAPEIDRLGSLCQCRSSVAICSLALHTPAARLQDSVRISACKRSVRKSEPFSHANLVEVSHIICSKAVECRLQVQFETQCE